MHCSGFGVIVLRVVPWNIVWNPKGKVETKFQDLKIMVSSFQDAFVQNVLRFGPQPSESERPLEILSQTDSPETSGDFQGAGRRGGGC